MATELIVVGTGGLAKEIAQLARAIDPCCERWKQLAYSVNEPGALGQRMPYGKVLYLDEDVCRREMPCDVAIAVGNPAVRMGIADVMLKNPNLSFPNLIHPSVDLDFGTVKVGVGNQFTKGVVITCDISIGHFNLFNLNSTVGHDTSVGSFNVINPGTNISGRVSIENECLLGTGCQILEGLSISSNATVGAGAVVTCSIASAGVFVGIPAKRLKLS